MTPLQAIKSAMTLRELRAHLALTQVQMAERLGVSQAHYSAYERKTRKLTAKSCARFVAELNVAAVMTPNRCEDFAFVTDVHPELGGGAPALTYEDDVDFGAYRAIGTYLANRSDVERQWTRSFELACGTRVVLGRSTNPGVHKPEYFVRVLGDPAAATAITAALSQVIDEAPA